MDPSDRAELETLIGLFYPDSSLLGQFQPCRADAMPTAYRALLAHEHHMTVTVEAFHQCPVDVQVVARRVDENSYSRSILLSRQSDGAVVQFGIMRVNFAWLPDEVRDTILAEATPLGRILIRHGVMRTIHLHALWRVEPGAELCRQFRLDRPRTTYGRTARIECNGEPAIELLEIVSPVEGPAPGVLQSPLSE